MHLLGFFALDSWIVALVETATSLTRCDDVFVPNSECGLDSTQQAILAYKGDHKCHGIIK